jgi:endogenous inhibitor of DNA gyrase (YacG/DUF329 family)
MADRPAPSCPICGKPTEPRFRPFCSRRCADLDLHRWFSGADRIETEETAENGGAEWTGTGDPARPMVSRCGPR